MANVNTFVNVNWTTNVTGCAASLTANPRLAGLRARNFRLRFAKSRLASLGLLLQPHPDPTPWIGDETDALAFERLLNFHDRGKIALDHALVGKDAPNLSAAVISRLTAEWKDEYDRWQKRDLPARRYVYVWADGV